MLKELQEFGLLEKEARVYLASLEIGKATADELSKHAQIKRPTTYVQIESLIKKGLMSTYEEGKKTYFTPESPEYLRRLFEKKRSELELKESELEKLLPGLKDLFEHAGERPRVRFFEGKGGLITMREEILKTKTGEMKVMFSHPDLLQVFPEEELNDFTKRRIQKGVHVKLLYTRKEGRFKEPTPQLTEERYIPEKLFPLESFLYLYDNTVALASLKGKIVGVIIENKEIARSINSVFELAWETAAKYNK